jgi:starch phosphorylase
MSAQIDQVRSANSSEVIKQAILDHLFYIQGKSKKFATANDWYMAVAYTVRDRLMKNWMKTLEKLEDKNIKVVGYLSAEFLMGPHLGNALINLGIEDQVKEAVTALGLNFTDIISQEEEPGLGNGGLGRLAACYLDSLSTTGVPAVGYGIRYEFGIFDQEIKDGWQVEITDKWLRYGNPWEIARPELTYRVKYGGYTETYTDENGKYRVRWIPDIEVKGVAYDTPVPGYKNEVINLLRLWKSEAVESFDFSAFNTGDYYGSVDKKITAENVSKVLYPNDELEQGKKLRLSQQYFFVSCSLQDVLYIQAQRNLSIDDLPNAAALQLNDTHPAIAVAELMRLLIDERHLDWDKAWEITQKTLSYTNHTLLPEALEKWSLPLFRELLPRHLEIIYEINDRFIKEVKTIFPGDDQMIQRISIIDENGQKSVRMANLAIIGGHAVNGVSALHSELLKKELLYDFYKISPGKFFNVTNGVTPRRWIRLYNPKLTDLISAKISENWITHLEDELIKLKACAEDPSFLNEWQQIKLQNKIAFAERIKQRVGVTVNPASLFDIQVKRIHEYKRQHLNVLHILTLYNRIKRNRDYSITPRTFIFGGKAAPGYAMAKLIIKLINSVADIVNNDPEVNDLLKVVFYPDFNVKNSEWIYRTADLSEQISTAGKEASGTGNMKFSMNGALTIGTLDGANVEMLEEVGRENFFLFGATVEDIASIRSQGYNPYLHYQQNDQLREVIDLLQSGSFSNGDRQIFQPIIQSLLGNDPYFLMQDYQSYIDCQQTVSNLYNDAGLWAKKSVLNVAGMGKFSSDRAIREYCKKIWNVKPAF